MQMLKCEKCGTAMELSDGWTPSYNNPDNHNMDPESEPYCPKCDVPNYTFEELYECKSPEFPTKQLCHIDNETLTIAFEYAHNHCKTLESAVQNVMRLTQGRANPQVVWDYLKHYFHE